MHKITLSEHQFEGPLDLLLSLIEEQKLDITQVSLAAVTEQFLGYIKNLENLDPTNLADYLAIAAKLLVIKSKAILPTLEIDDIEEDDGDDLTQKLILYQQYKEVAKAVKRLDNRRRQSFTRETIFSERVHFFPDPTITPQRLQEKVLGVLEGLKELDSLPKAKVKEAVSIQEKIDQLQLVLSAKIETKMSDLLANAKDKGEVIVTFLALLELIKQRIFTVDQEALFTDITIKQYQAHQQAPETEIINTDNHDQTE